MTDTNSINTIFAALSEAKVAMEQVPQLQAKLAEAEAFTKLLEDDIESKDAALRRIDAANAELESALAALRAEREAYFLRATEAEGKLDQMAGLLGLTPKTEVKAEVKAETIAPTVEEAKDPIADRAVRQSFDGPAPSFLGYPIRPAETVAYSFVKPSQPDLMSSTTVPLPQPSTEAPRSIGYAIGDDSDDEYRLNRYVF